MRILLVTHETSRTGAPRVAAVVARGLVSRGHDVRVEARTRGPLLPEFESIAPTSVEFLLRVRRRLRNVRGLGFLGFLVDTVQALGAILRHRPDLVYVNSTAASIYLRPARWLRRRVLLHVHESGAVASDFFARARLKVLPAGVEVIACSPSVESELCALLPGIADRVHLVPSVPDDELVMRLGQHAADWDVTDGDLVVGCCGAIELRKGVDLWMQVALLVRSQIPDVPLRFLWIGDGDPPEGAREAGVQFIGPRENPYPYIQRFDVFTLPSRDDPFPLVVVEAMLLGRPVVAFEVGGVSEQLGVAGLLASPNNVAGFAGAVVRLLEDEQSRRRLGGLARDRAFVEFSTAAFMNRIEDLIASAAGARDGDQAVSGSDPRRKYLTERDATQTWTTQRSGSGSR